MSETDHSPEFLQALPVQKATQRLEQAVTAVERRIAATQVVAGAGAQELAMLKAENQRLRQQLQEKELHCQKLEKLQQKVSRRLDDSIARVQQALALEPAEQG